MKRLILLFISFHIAQCTCPTGFDLVRDGECRGYYTRIDTTYDNTVNLTISKCKEIKGKPIIIHNEEHQSYWRSKVVSEWTVIGLVCNSNTNQYEWSDGSPVDFKPPSGFYNMDLDKSCRLSEYCWVLRADGYWSYYYCNIHDRSSTDVFCSTQLSQPVPAGDGCESFEDDSEDGVCYQVGARAESWHDAQKECRNFGADLAAIHSLTENSFVRRLAVSKGAVNGVFLGVTVSAKENDFGWIDGSEWDFDYFSPEFPIDGKGDCIAMDTLAPSGEWINKNCSDDLAFACVRPQNLTHPTCHPGPWKEGQVIFTPGFPYDASTPCEFILTVEAGKKVEVEIYLMEANSCCDHLILTDDLLGGPQNIVANLTGEISNQTSTTKSSNLMRVSWQPNGGVNVRGLMMTFRGV